LTVVTLDSTRTIGNLTFSDNALGGSPWLLRGTNTLTLDNGGSQAVITKTTGATISNPLSGTNVRINGGGVFNLTGNNTGLTGAVALGGVNGVNLGNANALGSAAITFVGGEVLGGTTRDIAITNSVTLNTTYWQGAFGLTLNGSLTLNANNQGFQTWAAQTDTVQAGPVSLGANNLSVAGGAVGGVRINGNITGTGGVAKAGSSTLTLAGANSYSGATTVTAGRLNFNATANTSDIAVSNAGTILGGEGSSSNSITMAADGVLAFDPSTAGALTTTGAVSIGGTVNLAFEPTQSLTDGATTVDVLKYGSLAGFSNLVIPAGLRSATLNDDTANSKVSLTLTTGSRVWSYNDANDFLDWDVLTTNNWSGGDSLFANGDSVIFNDTSTDGGITLGGQARPAAVTFDNSVTDFTITPLTPNTDLITGTASITKLGTATATLAGPNSFTGGATIQSGTLAFANGGLGTYGPITMDGGTLRWHTSNTQDISRRLFLVDGKSATFDTGANNVSFNTSLGGSTATTASVVKTGTGILTLTNANSSGAYTGGTTINEGTISLGAGGTGNFTCSPTALGTGAVTINTGARLRLWIQNSQTHTFTNNLAIDGGRLHGEDGIYNVNGTIAVGTGGATFSGVWGGKNLNINGVISGDGPVTTESSSSQVRFFANNT
jgi:autotransporter-associated beta strand protein